MPTPLSSSAPIATAPSASAANTLGRPHIPLLPLQQLSALSALSSPAHTISPRPPNDSLPLSARVLPSSSGGFVSVAVPAHAISAPNTPRKLSYTTTSTYTVASAQRAIPMQWPLAGNYSVASAAPAAEVRWPSLSGSLSSSVLAPGTTTFATPASPAPSPFASFPSVSAPAFSPLNSLPAPSISISLSHPNTPRDVPTSSLISPTVFQMNKHSPTRAYSIATPAAAPTFATPSVSATTTASPRPFTIPPIPTPTFQTASVCFTLPPPPTTPRDPPLSARLPTTTITTMPTSTTTTTVYHFAAPSAPTANAYYSFPTVQLPAPAPAVFHFATPAAFAMPPPTSLSYQSVPETTRLMSLPVYQPAYVAYEPVAYEPAAGPFPSHYLPGTMAAPPVAAATYAPWGISYAL
eukprot:EG_transcript_5996